MDWNPYYVAFAASNGRTPEEQLTVDGHLHHEFLRWIHGQWLAYFASIALPAHTSSVGHHAAFTLWLGKAGR